MASKFESVSHQFLSSLDEEITRLQQIREQIATALGTGTKRTSAPQRKRKGMSADGRRRIAEAQKARWAKQKRDAKKTPVKKTAAKKTPPKRPRATAVKAAAAA